MKILVVEDEPKLNENIVEELRDRGYAVDFGFDGEEGEGLARINCYDLIILDIMLPKRDGLTVCQNLRNYGIQTPISSVKAIFTTLLAAVAGISLLVGGIGISFVVSKLGIVNTSISWPSVLLAFGVSAAIGIIFGYYPARRAAGLNPIVALRYE